MLLQTNPTHLQYTPPKNKRYPSILNKCFSRPTPPTSSIPLQRTKDTPVYSTNASPDPPHPPPVYPSKEQKIPQYTQKMLLQTHPTHLQYTPPKNKRYPSILKKCFSRPTPPTSSIPLQRTKYTP